MGNIIGILSTVILVSTLATLIFAVIAYVMARRRRAGIEDETTVDTEDIPDYTEPLRAPSGSGQSPPSSQTQAAAAASASPVGNSAPGKSSASEASVPNESPSGPKESKPLFRQLTPYGEKPVEPAKGADKNTGWDWE